MICIVKPKIFAGNIPGNFSRRNQEVLEKRYHVELIVLNIYYYQRIYLSVQNVLV